MPHLNSEEVISVGRRKNTLTYDTKRKIKWGRREYTRSFFQVDMSKAVGYNKL